MASLATSAARKTLRELHGVVVTAGLMEKTVKVRVGGLKWNNFLKKVIFRFSISKVLPLLGERAGADREAATTIALQRSQDISRPRPQQLAPRRRRGRYFSGLAHVSTQAPCHQAHYQAVGRTDRGPTADSEPGAAQCGKGGGPEGKTGAAGAEAGGRSR